MQSAEAPEAPQQIKPAGKERLGDYLVQNGFLTPDQLDIAIREQRRSGGLLGESITHLGFLSNQVMTAILADRAGWQQFDPKSCIIDPEVVNLVPREVALQCQSVPLSIVENVIHVAMVDPQDILAHDRLKRLLPSGTSILPWICAPDELSSLVDRVYSHALSIDAILRELDEDSNASLSLEDFEDDYQHPLIRLVNALLLDAVKSGASDIHIEPEEYFLRVRYRIDGTMRQIRNFDTELISPICLRLKLMSGMNIADRLTAQDGRFELRIGRRNVDFRVSSLPTIHGDNVVLRILDQSGSLIELSKLGLSTSSEALIRKMLKTPQGLIVVTGPTGSGKTTTLYSMLATINSPDVNVMTLEDPVEFQMSLLRQTQVREGSVDFSNGIRAMMRQDPDVIFIGEIRDEDTALMALRAAMTGHRVFSTLHTNDSFGVISRLLDLGVQKTVLVGNIIGILSQRLARKLCVKCKKPKIATEDERRILDVQGSEPVQIYEAVGCDACGSTGYKGRVSVVEILVVNEELNDLIMIEAPPGKLKEAARENGFLSIIDDAARKVLDGEISIDSMVSAVDVTSRL